MRDERSSVHPAGIAAVPVVVTAIGYGILLSKNGDMLMFWSVVGIGLLVVMLVGGFRYYAAHPAVGLLTAVCLAGLFPQSQAAMASDSTQMVLGILSGGIGMVLMITFAVLTVADMRKSVGTDERVMAKARRA
ncbi:MAG TPA: hypothetical protein VH253_05835 [Phycisphaerae bacterium]|nr:hypothetical protein [Phycisphaerae bacterium]